MEELFKDLTKFLEKFYFKGIKKELMEILDKFFTELYENVSFTGSDGCFQLDASWLKEQFDEIKSKFCK